MPPTVRNLVNPTPKGHDGAKALTSPAVPASGSTLALPGWATQLPALPTVEDKPTCTFLATASNRSKNWPSQQAAGLADGEFYLGHDGQILAFKQGVRFYLLTAERFFTRMDNSGAVTKAARENPDPDDRSPNRLDEHYVSVIVVEYNGRLIPAKADFRGTKAGAIEPMIVALEQAADPAWARLSDAHKVAAQFPHPFGRVVGLATVQPRTSKASGNRYFMGRCTPTPATVTDMERLALHLQSEEFVAALHAAGNAKQARCDEFAKLAG